MVTPAVTADVFLINVLLSMIASFGNKDIERQSVLSYKLLDVNKTYRKNRIC